MKKILILSIDFYKAFLSVILKSIIGTPDTCRFQETCSDYSKRIIKEKGAMRGATLSFIRILKCQPFAYNV